MKSSFGMASGQLVKFNAGVAGFAFEIEGRGFGLQCAFVGIEQFENSGFASTVGSFGDTH
jgi:hypothetical protein